MNARHVGWCDGDRLAPTDDGKCRVCGFAGKLTKYGNIRPHKKREAAA